MSAHSWIRCALLLSAGGAAIGSAQAQTPATTPPGTNAANPAVTQTAAADTVGDTATTDGEMVVTGSRIVANGFSAPTPVTVVTTAELFKKAPESIAAALNQLPQFVGTAGSNVTSSQAGTPSAGNYLNLRRLGAIETLLLLDGQRLPPTSFDGTTDANIIPQALIQRVDVVTGGASAAYGSDAVAGVVNFVLDTKFVGVKATGQMGISSRGDNEQQRVSIAAGQFFMDGKLHLEGSFDYFFQPGIANNGLRPNGGDFYGGYVNVGANAARPCAAGACAENPFTPVFNVRLANGTYGTLINAGRTAAQAEARAGTSPFSLAGFTFEPTLVGGPVSAFGAHRADLGTATGTPNFNVGGADTAVTFGATLTSLLRTKQAFGRADYDFGDNVTGFLQGSWSTADTRYVTVGAGTQFQSFQIYADNAFLPAGVADAMRREGLASFVGSRVEADQHPKEVLTTNESWTILGGLKGDLGPLRWTANFSHGQSKLATEHYGNFDQPKWFAALDAVDAGQLAGGARNGNIICRADVTLPGKFPGCKPWNPFGNGSPSAASYSYFQDEPSRYRVYQRQIAFAANISGPLFELPAGPLNFAVGGEYRKQRLEQISNTDPSKPIPLFEPGLNEASATNPANLNGIPEGLRTAANPFNLLWNSTNVGNSFGTQNIGEVYGEIAVPLLRDVAFFQTLDLNGAVRYTDYSVSGSIWAWKVGGSWSPVDGLRIRSAYSQDIRAPTLYELFQGVGSTRGTFTDVHTGANTNLIVLNRGNPDLAPEIARTLTVGAVWQPAFFPSFSMSLDYYKIRIRDQISRPNTTLINQLCEDANGSGPACDLIIRPFPFANRTAANFPLSIATVPINQSSVVTEGIDYELAYRLGLGGAGRVDLRLFGNYTPTFTSIASPGTLPIILAGAAAGVPKHRITAAIDYSNGGFGAGLGIRYMGPLYYTLQPNVFVTNNRIAPVTYLNVNVSQDVAFGSNTATFFLNIQNLTDKIVFAPQNNAQPTEFYPSFQSQYDVVGRYFVVGVRAKF